MSRSEDQATTDLPATTSRTPLRRIQIWLFALFFAIPALGGLLSFLQVVRDNQNGVDGLGGIYDVALSPSGEQVYAVGQDDNALVVMSRSPHIGSLSFVETYKDGENGVFGLLGASGVAASPDGRHVYAVAEADDTLVVFGRDATLDELAFIASQVKENGVGSVFGLNGARAVAVSPDDTQVFVASRVDDALAVFSRSATTDDLQYIEAEFDGVSGADGLNGAVAVAVSPDSRHVYVASEIENSVAVFERMPLSGNVIYASKVTDGEDGVEGLKGASGVAASPDGLHVYATGTTENALVAFSRNFFTGELTQVAVYRDGEDGIDGLAGAAGVTLNPFGNRLLVASKVENAVAVFRRDILTGHLALLEVLRDGVGGVEGLAGALALTANQDNAYVAGHDEDALAGFDLALCQGNEATGDSDGDAFCDDVDLCLGDDLTGDSDADTICNDLDACPGFDDLQDGDGDLVPDFCDDCTGDDAIGDSDLDGVCDDLDVCQGANDGQDGDGDGVPDGCDLCLGNDATADLDGDGICTDLDLCQGDDATGDADSDGLCADTDCDDNNPGVTSACMLIFEVDFESGDFSGWTSAVF